MDEKDGEQHNLKPTLGLFDATAISIGAIIGAGIFVVTGIAAGWAGSALVLSMLTAALISLFTALSFAKLTAWLPKEGSVYEFTYQLISPFAGFLTGWMWILSNTFAGAAVSLSFAYYLTALFSNLNANYVAAILCIGFTALNYYGIRQSAFLNNIFVIAKLIILAFFIVLGLWFVNSANFAPFAPFEFGVLYGAFYIFFAYGGFARVAVIAEEVKDARRNVPRAILLSLAIATVFYVLTGAVAVGLVGVDRLAGSNAPLTEAISATENQAAVFIVSAGGQLATASVLLTSILGVSRMAYAMAKRNDLPRTLGKLHSKFNTPYYSIWMTGLTMALLVLFIDLTGVVAISTFALLFYYALANISALRLETNKKIHSRITSILGAALCITMLVLLPFISPQALAIGVAALIAGSIYYKVKGCH